MNNAGYYIFLGASLDGPPEGGLLGSGCAGVPSSSCSVLGLARSRSRPLPSLARIKAQVYLMMQFLNFPNPFNCPSRLKYETPLLFRQNHLGIEKCNLRQRWAAGSIFPYPPVGHGKIERPTVGRAE